MLSVTSGLLGSMVTASCGGWLLLDGADGLWEAKERKMIECGALEAQKTADVTAVARGPRRRLPGQLPRIGHVDPSLLYTCT